MSGVLDIIEVWMSVGAVARGSLVDAAGKIVVHPAGPEFDLCVVGFIDLLPRARRSHPALWLFFPTDGRAPTVVTTNLPQHPDREAMYARGVRFIDLRSAARREERERCIATLHGLSSPTLGGMHTTTAAAYSDAAQELLRAMPDLEILENA